MLDEITFAVPLEERRIDIVGRLLDRCSSVRHADNTAPGTANAELFARWRQPRNLFLYCSALPIFNAAGIERMKTSLDSVDFSDGLTREDADSLFPSSSSCGWPALRKLVVEISDDCAVNVLERMVSHCPALTTLNIELGCLPDAENNACGLSEQSLHALGANLLSLFLGIDDPRQMDFLEQLSLRSPHLTHLQLIVASSDTPTPILQQALPRFRCLSAFALIACGSGIDLDPLLNGLTAVASQLRSLDIDLQQESDDSHLDRIRALLELRPWLDCFHLYRPDSDSESAATSAFLADLQRMVLEERAKGSGRLELSDFVLSLGKGRITDPFSICK